MFGVRDFFFLKKNHINFYYFFSFFFNNFFNYQFTKKHCVTKTKILQTDDPPFLPVGTEVSAKYKGAFCEAKVRKVVRSVKCKVNYFIAYGYIF